MANRLLTKGKRCGSFEKRLFPSDKNKQKQISFPTATKTQNEEPEVSAWMKWKLKVLRGKVLRCRRSASPGIYFIYLFFLAPPHYPAKPKTRCLPARDSSEISARKELRRDERLNFKFNKQRWNADEEGEGKRVAPSQIVFRVLLPRCLPATERERERRGVRKRRKQRRRYYVCAPRVNFGSVEKSAGERSHCHPWLSLILGGKERGGGRDGLIK